MLPKIELRTTISFYKYFNIRSPKKIQNLLNKIFGDLSVFGRVYLAYEGINAQISIPKKNIEALRLLLCDLNPKFEILRFNIALDNNRNSFRTLHVKVKNRIVSDGITDPTFDFKNVGEYLKAEDVNNMFEDPNVIFVDMRNYYEYEIGHFKNALKIPASTFREQLSKVIGIMQKYKNKKVVTYCTGGIRCEKASAWMKHNGFKKVWQIEDGIIGYVRYSREMGLPIHFVGKNFVFDSRMSEKVSDDIIARCYQCNMPYDIHSNCKNSSCHLLFIQCESCARKFEGCCSELCLTKHRFFKKNNFTLQNS